MSLISDDKLRKMLEGPDGLICKAQEEDIDVARLATYATAILIEINRWGGNERDMVFRGGYVHEKARKLFETVCSKNPYHADVMEELTKYNNSIWKYNKKQKWLKENGTIE